MSKKRSIMFLSSTYNHHQKFFCRAMFDRIGDSFSFLETRPLRAERIALGWRKELYPSYVISFSRVEENCEKINECVSEANVVITGSAPVSLTRKRINENKLTFRYSERPLKNGLELWKYPIRYLRWHRNNPQNKRVYMLCASAYTAEDYRKFGLFKNRCFKWGYFPEIRTYDNIGRLIEEKAPNSLIWVARYIDWKHPEIAVEVARRLKRDGYSFDLQMIGNGMLLEKTKSLITENDLENEVHVLGAMTPEDVRTHMEKSQIHIFTSDRKEGWGVVLNEAMNSACVSVANYEIGSAPYLINSGENGFHYQSVDELYEKVKFLLDHQEKREAMAKAAYATIVSEWNAEVAAERFLQLCDAVDRDEETPFLTGPCSKASD